MLLKVALFAIGLVYANFAEWFLHKVVLHDLARKKRWRRLFGFHWYRHHRQSRQNDFLDPDYLEPIYSWNARTKEVLGLILVVLIHMPVCLYSTYLFTGMLTHVVLYYVVHWKAHMNKAWAMKWVPWHVEHHMGKDQDKNFCVTYPLADFVLGTRSR